MLVVGMASTPFYVRAARASEDESALACPAPLDKAPTRPARSRGLRSSRLAIPPAREETTWTCQSGLVQVLSANLPR
jgi:hypothetical protein